MGVGGGVRVGLAGGGTRLGAMVRVANGVYATGTAEGPIAASDVGVLLLPGEGDHVDVIA